jgi:hypothetical protein
MIKADSVSDDKADQQMFGRLLMVVICAGPIALLFLLFKREVTSIFGALSGKGGKEVGDEQKAELPVNETERLESEDMTPEALEEGNMVTSSEATKPIEEGHGKKTEMKIAEKSPLKKTSTGVVEKVAPCLSKSPQLQTMQAVEFEQGTTESEKRIHTRNRAKSLDEDPMLLSSKEPQNLMEFVSVDSLDEEMRNHLDASSDSKPRLTSKRVDASSERPKSRSPTPSRAPRPRSLPKSSPGFEERKSCKSEATLINSRSSIPLNAPGSRNSSSVEARKSRSSTPVNAAGLRSSSSVEARKSRSSTPLNAAGSRTSSLN